MLLGVTLVACQPADTPSTSGDTSSTSTDGTTTALTSQVSEPTGKSPAPPEPTSSYSHEPDSATLLRDITPDTLIDHDYTLFDIHCAEPEAASTGLLHDVGDQAYGASDTDRLAWGYVPTDYLEPVSGQVDGENIVSWGVSADRRGELFRAGEVPVIEYRFDLPPATYRIEWVFSDPFSTQPFALSLNDEPRDPAEAFKMRTVTREERYTLTEGSLSVKVTADGFAQDPMKTPMLTRIIIRSDYATSDEALTHYRETIREALDGPITTDSREALERASEQLETATAAEDDARTERVAAIHAALKGVEERMQYESFHPGEPWLDMNNDPIQAHGGQVQRLTYTDQASGEEVTRWWWVGEDKTHGYRGGIRAYSSDDLYNWRSEGIVMRNIKAREDLDEDPYFTALYAGADAAEKDRIYQAINNTTSVIERPKMIKNARTGKYIMWFHADGPTADDDSNYAAASAGVAVADHPAGPFRYIDRYRLHTCPEGQKDFYPDEKGMARDMNLFVDDDGTAYIIYASEENYTLYISKLNEDYTYLAAAPDEAVYGEDYVRILPGGHREAPAPFKRDGRYYMITSGCTGWTPNQAQCAVADAMLGEWTNLGDPTVGDTKETTFDSQSTCVFEYPLASGAKRYIFMADRWEPEDLSTSSYVWLPMDFLPSGEPEIRWHDRWTLEALEEE